LKHESAGRRQRRSPRENGDVRDEHHGQQRPGDRERRARICADEAPPNRARPIR
jgi:hypothetical protein